MKKTLTVLSLLFLAVTANGYLLTEDIPNLIQNIATYAKEAASYLQQVQVNINTNTTAFRELQQVENEILELERMGDPKALTSISGVSNIQTLMQMYQQAQIDVDHIASMVNPASAGLTVNQMMSTYGQTGFNGFTSGMGMKFGTPINLIQFQTSDYNVANATKDRIAALIAKKNGFSQQLATVTQQLASATDQSQIMKYHGVISGLEASINDINAQIQQATESEKLQIAMNDAAQNVSRTMQGVQASVAYQQSLESGITTVNATGGIEGTATEFGWVDGPANGGNGDPGTSGNWYTGAGGADIGSQSSVGVSLPAATEVAQFGSTQAAQGQMVTVTNTATGVSSTVPIVDIGPGSTAVANGVVADLTYGTARTLGLPVNGTAPVSVSFPSK